MRLLMIQGDFVGIYEVRARKVQRLGIFAGAKQLDVDSAENVRRMPKSAIEAAPVEEPTHEAPQS